ncbi:hypothetical protein [Legionella fallonii]|uniref:Uncharacterized protein n=1 Tax=Legionella fallonii LLAP-10 TaxID=1212491 RepID=A0A098G553_9GAMM|nr:hypothetical protein [Legionella fallonii]CEG56625.1 conserved protein of unknown function [Legionella fallonii LLAP-10]
MHPQKKIYAKEIYQLVAIICKQMSDEHNSEMQSVLNISNKDTYDIINKIMIALPDSYFYNANKSMLYDMLAFISKNLILFQIQENIEEDDYAYHLIDFINSLSISIATRYYQ